MSIYEHIQTIRDYIAQSEPSEPRHKSDFSKKAAEAIEEIFIYVDEVENRDIPGEDN